MHVPVSCLQAVACFFVGCCQLSMFGGQHVIASFSALQLCADLHCLIVFNGFAELYALSFMLMALWRLRLCMNIRGWRQRKFMKFWTWWSEVRALMQ